MSDLQQHVMTFNFSLDITVDSSLSDLELATDIASRFRRALTEGAVAFVIDSVTRSGDGRIMQISTHLVGGKVE